MKQKSLEVAKKNKNDEFYTQYSDIEKELMNYKDELEGKVIYCNCDDPNMSQFYRYFYNNFKQLNLKKVIFTYLTEKEPSYCVELIEKDGNIEKQVTEQIGNGSFNSPASISKLEESDIVVTNPPFSLFREFVDLMMSRNKLFLIVGSQNAISYKKTFRYIINEKLSLGYTCPKVFTNENKEKIQFGNICWFTNLNVNKELQSLKNETSNKQQHYLKYDNYDAIEIPKLKDLPIDYNGVMGVPITFLHYFNKKEYRILGMNDGSYDYEFKPTKRYENVLQHSANGKVSNGSKINTRSALKVDDDYSGTYYQEKGKTARYKMTYSRIFIQKIDN